MLLSYKMLLLFAGADGGGNPSPRGLARCPGSAPASHSLSWNFLLCQAPTHRHGRARRPAAGAVSWQPLPRAHRSLGRACEEGQLSAQGTASRNPALGASATPASLGPAFSAPFQGLEGPSAEAASSAGRGGRGGMCMRLLHLGPTARKQGGTSG